MHPITKGEVGQLTIWSAGRDTVNWHVATVPLASVTVAVTGAAIVPGAIELAEAGLKIMFPIGAQPPVVVRAG